jgi:hypothetical protein
VESTSQVTDPAAKLLNGEKMKTTALVLGILVLSGSLWGQTTQRIADSIKIGTAQLSLGMHQKEASAEIARAGYKTLDLPAEGGYARVAVTDRDLADKVQTAVAAVDNEGVLYFRSETLVRIQHKITDETASGRDLAFALYAAVRDLENRGSTQCSVKTTEETYPDVPTMDAKTILLTCRIADSYRTTHIRWVTNEKLQSQFPVGVFQELWR